VRRPIPPAVGPRSVDFDIVIVGGGLVGASLACALGDTGLRVAVLEALPPGDPGQPSYDDRTIALAFSSRRIFEGIGVWADIADRSVCAIEHIHISDRGRFGLTRLHAADMDIEALGYVAETRALGYALYERMANFENVELICPAVVRGIDSRDSHQEVVVEHDGQERRMRARLLVAADGGDSVVRRAAGISSHRRAYGQTAVVANVTPGHSHGNTAYERFTRSGPLAILPMAADRCAVVWSVEDEEVDAMLAWSDEEYLARLQERFGDRLGRFSRAGKRVAYPLALTHVDEFIGPRLVLVGNAAHTVHPVAGQGFNLGLRDVATLAQVLVDAAAGGRDMGAPAVLQDYADWRTRDNRRVAAFTDGLIRIFANDFPPLALARNLGLFAVDLFPSAKRAFIRRTSGLNGRMPRLARGLPLVERR
jgi:2-octaprenyl-6-methoxyphenol hydroxylase